jgi:hypothetical protein
MGSTAPPREVKVKSSIVRRGHILVLALLLVLVVSLVAGVSSARAAKLTLAGGKTQLTVTADIADLLIAQGFPLYPIPPATVAMKTDNSFVYTLPVTTGKWNTTTKTGTIKHKGGILWTHNTGTAQAPIRFMAPTIVVATTPQVTAIFPDTTRQPLFTLDLTSATVKKVKVGTAFFVQIKAVVFAGTPELDVVFNNAYGIGLGAGNPLGTVTVMAKVKS